MMSTLSTTLTQRVLGIGDGSLVAPFLATIDLLRLSEVCSWLLPYRNLVSRLKLVKNPSSTLPLPLPLPLHHLHQLLWDTRQLTHLRIANLSTLPFIVQWIIAGRPLHLQSLDLSSLDDVTDHHAEQLAQALSSGHCSQLQHLDLSNIHRITEEGFMLIFQALRHGCCPRLKGVNLSWNGSLANGGHHLASVMEAGAFSRLEKIDLSNTIMEEEGVSAIANALRNRRCPNLQSFILMSCKAGHGLSALGGALAEGACAQLKELVLSWNQGVNDADVMALARGLEGSPHLTRLDLSDIKLTALGVRALAESLMGGACPHLERLDLSYNVAVDNEGMKWLSYALAQSCCPELRYLDVTFTGMTVVGLCYLLDAFDTGACVALEELWMRSNDLYMGMMHLAKTLEQEGALPRLEVLGLSVTQCRDDGVLSLARAFAGGACPRLRLLYVLNGNHISRSAVNQLATSFASRPKPAKVL